MKKTIYLAITLIVMSMALALSAGTQKNEPVLVKIDNFSFNPSKLTIPAGTTVTWLNNDDVPHTVVSAARAFKSAVLDTGDRFSRQFDTPGTYDYYCSIHPHMKGKVVVQ